MTNDKNCMQQVVERIGESVVTDSGYVAMITVYRKYSDIDVFFPELNITKEHVNYGNFSKGQVSPFTRVQSKSHIGERVFQTGCEMMATIVECPTLTNLTVEFENQRRRSGVHYASFRSGNVSPYTPEERLEIDKKERIGQKINMRGGECEIVEYFNASNITVRFNQDQTLVYNRTYSQFVNKKIKNPNATCNVEQQSQRLFTRKLMNCGYWATCTAYHDANDISVTFEVDGTVVEHRGWKSFVRGEIAYPGVAPVRDGSLREGEIRRMNNSMRAVLETYRSSLDVDVRFLDDGALVKTRYDHFLDGCVEHPTKKMSSTISLQEFAIRYYLKKYGFVKIKSGEWDGRGFGKFELDFFHEVANIGIEYDGEIHKIKDAVQRDIDKNLKCKDIGVCLYRLRASNLPELEDGNSINFTLDKNDRVRSRLTDCKRELELILSSHGIAFEKDDIDFKRDADDIIYQYDQVCVNFYRNLYVGKTVYNEIAQQNMTIVAYHNYDNVDVEFADGSIKRGVSYARFLDKQVGHPAKDPDLQAKQRLGQVGINNSGLEMRIVRYGAYSDIDVIFTADNKRRNNRTYNAFLQGTIAHPDDARKRKSKKVNDESV